MLHFLWKVVNLLEINDTMYIIGTVKQSLSNMEDAIESSLQILKIHSIRELLYC